jgi:hypothetical protein
MSFQTEFDFILPKGYVDSEGNVNKEGLMKLSTSGIEIHTQRDPRVKANPAYAPCIILSRVITKLGRLTAENGSITPDIISSLFISDFKYLLALYEKINQDSDPSIDATCPNCSTKFKVDLGDLQ